MTLLLTLQVRQVSLVVALIAMIGMLGRPASGKTVGEDSKDGNLRIYFVDVEGGQATLLVSPKGESLLIDTGWPGKGSRDANRIVSVAKEAGLRKIDYVLITHYHDDHVGGVPQLVEQIPAGTFIDHGPNRELDHGVTEHGYAEYQKVLAATHASHIIAQPGEDLPMRDLRVTVVSADGALIAKPLAGAGGKNLFCRHSENRPPDQTENARSVGIVVTFGRLKILDLGDLTWDKETQLMCPIDKLGPVDIYIVSHHGWYQSSSPALVDGIRPLVSIMDNGATKGGSTATLKTLADAPGLQRRWQLHFSEEGGLQYNPADRYIANPRGEDGNFLELIASRAGSFKVLNPKTGFSETYTSR